MGDIAALAASMAELGLLRGLPVARLTTAAAGEKQPSSQQRRLTMSDGTKPKIELVGPGPSDSGEHNPASVFDDLATLRKQSKLAVQRKTVLVNVEVDKPANNVYFRVNEHPDFQLDDATVLRDTEGTRKAFYYVVPAMRAHPKLAPRLRKVTLSLVYTWPGGNILIWPVPIVSDREFKVWKSARAAFDLAQTEWVQIVWSEEKSDYEVEVAERVDRQPVWPAKTFSELLKLAFADKVIDNEEHPYVRRLRGILD
jgi:hypothetical protein